MRSIHHQLPLYLHHLDSFSSIHHDQTCPESTTDHTYTTVMTVFGSDFCKPNLTSTESLNILNARLENRQQLDEFTPEEGDVGGYLLLKAAVLHYIVTNVELALKGLSVSADVVEFWSIVESLIDRKVWEKENVQMEGKDAKENNPKGLNDDSMNIVTKGGADDCRLHANVDESTSGKEDEIMEEVECSQPPYTMGL